MSRVRVHVGHRESHLNGTAHCTAWSDPPPFLAALLARLALDIAKRRAGAGARSGALRPRVPKSTALRILVEQPWAGACHEAARAVDAALWASVRPLRSMAQAQHATAPTANGVPPGVLYLQHQRRAQRVGHQAERRRCRRHGTGAGRGWQGCRTGMPTCQMRGNHAWPLWTSPVAGRGGCRVGPSVAREHCAGWRSWPAQQAYTWRKRLPGGIAAVTVALKAGARPHELRLSVAG